MKAMKIALAASLLLTAMPIALASEGDCATPRHEGVDHPLRAGSYLYLDATHPEKVGEWTEGNGIGGLQTSMCFAFGIFRYDADVHHGLLP